MRIILVTALFCIMFGCAKKEKEESKPHENPIEDLIPRQEFYCTEHPRDEYGFIESHECDSILFTSLIRVACEESFDLTVARDENGLWHRTPERNCYEEGRSGSQVSKDGIVGISWALYFDDLLRDDLLSLYDYGDSHRWVYGKGPLDRTYLVPVFQNTLGIISGRGRPAAVLDIYADPVKDHQRHIVALDIILRGEASGEIPDDAYDLLRSFRNLEPSNALFVYGYHRFGDGDQTETIEILKNEVLFPSDQLPDNTHRCGRWLWERSSESHNWQPCDEEKTHSGGDYALLVWLLKKSYNKD